MKKTLYEICNKTVEVMHELYGEPEMDSRMRIALFLAAQESIAKNMERLNEKDVEEYVYCATVLKLYQLLGKKANISKPVDFDNRYGSDGSNIICCLGGVWFSNCNDRDEALEICGIDAEFQKECARFGLGGA